MGYKRGLRLLLGILGASLVPIHVVHDASVAQSQLEWPCRVGDYFIPDYQRLPPTEQHAFVERHRQKYSSPLQQALDALRVLHADPSFYVIGRLKPVKSIQEKIKRKKYRCFSELTDVAGTRLIIADYAALQLVTEWIERHFLIREKQDLMRDEAKTGYRAVHYLAWVDGRIVEIQIHTRRSTLWAEASHQLVFKGPFADNEALVSYLNRLSQQIFLLDSGLQGQIPEIPATLPAEAREILTETIANIIAVGKPSSDSPVDSRSQNIEETEDISHDFFALDEFGALTFVTTGPGTAGR